MSHDKEPRKRLLVSKVVDFQLERLGSSSTSIASIHRRAYLKNGENNEGFLDEHRMYGLISMKVKIVIDFFIWSKELACLNKLGC